eukprot:5234316-Pleurochrysis_carterae.AAC.1
MLMRRLGALLARKEGAKGAAGARAGGLVVQFRNPVNQRRFDNDLQAVSAAKAEMRLLIS